MSEEMLVRLRELVDENTPQRKIAKDLGVSTGTVNYWIHKIGLIPNAPHFEKAVSKSELEELVNRGFSGNQIAKKLNLSKTTTRKLLRKHNLTTDKAQERRTMQSRPKPSDVLQPEMELQCSKHGHTRFVTDKARDRYVCAKCRSGYVKSRRRKLKKMLVEENGGCCLWCGYNTTFRALHFHHLDPSEKGFHISRNSHVVALERLREEVKKTVLLCSNCHTEAEEGLIPLEQLQKKRDKLRSRLGRVSPHSDTV